MIFYSHSVDDIKSKIVTSIVITTTGKHYEYRCAICKKELLSDHEHNLYDCLYGLVTRIEYLEAQLARINIAEQAGQLKS